LVSSLGAQLSQNLSNKGGRQISASATAISRWHRQKRRLWCSAWRHGQTGAGSQPSGRHLRL